MSQLVRAFHLIALVAFSLAPPVSAQAGADGAPGRGSGEIIIRLAPGATESALSAGVVAGALVPIRPLSRRLGIWLVRYDSETLNGVEALTTARALPEVALAQFNRTVALRSSIPNDRKFGQLWNLHNTGQTGGTPDADVDAPEAWDLVRRGLSAHGDTLVVAIVDSAFQLEHPDLPLWKNFNEIPNNGADDDGNGYVDDFDGWNVYEGTGRITAESPHGIYVAGIAAASGDNELGVSGMIWDAQVLPVQLGSEVDSYTEAAVVEAYSYLHELRATYNETDGNAGAFIVAANSSFGIDRGDPADHPIWCAMYDELAAVGILSVGATANVTIDVDVVGDIPTACPSDFLVSATNTTHNDEKGRPAAYGATTIDLGAPGTDILSLSGRDGYWANSGTSAAAPHVAGGITLLIAGLSSARFQAYKNAPRQILPAIKAALLDGTDPLPDLQGRTVSGGRLNLYQSLLESFASDPATLVVGGPEVIENALFEGTNIYVLDTGALTLRGQVTLKEDALGAPSYLYVVGELYDQEAHVRLLDGSQIVYRSPRFSTAGEEPGSPARRAYALSDAYPNPFHGTASFTLEVAASQHVSVEVLDLLGRRVALLHDGPLQPGAPHAFSIDGRALPNGSYFVLATGSSFSAVTKATLLH